MRRNVSGRTAVLYCVAVLAMLLTGVWFLAGSGTAPVAAADNGTGTTFPGTGTGAIPDGGPGCGPLGTPRDVTFNVTGLSGSPTAVDVDMSMTHSWVGDLNVSLIAPDATEHVIFAGTGSTTPTGCGSANDLNGTYSFSDTATGTWWGSPNPFPPGGYRTSVAGDQPSPPAGDATSMNDAFAGVANANGTWTLRVIDGGGGDTGTISAANLTITTGAAPAGPVDNDYDGDGKTDFVMNRETAAARGLADYRKDGKLRIKTPQPEPYITHSEAAAPSEAGSSLEWWIANSGGGSPTAAAFGQSRFTDFATPSDYDGDGKTDLAIWRGLTTGQPSGNGFFYIFRSSDSTVQEVDFGQDGDNPTVVGDYDGDGKADPAVFRQNLGSPGQTFFYFKGSAGGGEITYVPWGNNTAGELKAYPGDFDGDGKMDFVIFRNFSGQGQFVLLRSSDFGVEYVDWGLDTDFLAPGDYDGDGKTDFMVVRLVIPGAALQWYLLERDGGGTGASPIYWGNAAAIDSEFLVPGDYDGDGATDIAVHRQDFSNVDNNWYYIRRSSDLTLEAFEWGAGLNDFPVNGWNVQ